MIFLEGTSQEDWAHAGMGSPFSLSFSSLSYRGFLFLRQLMPMQGPIWCSQYMRFEDYDQAWETELNCQYSDGSGANGATNIQWEGLVIKCDDDGAEFVSVETLTFDNMFTTAFTLTEPNTYVILTKQPFRWKLLT